LHLFASVIAFQTWKSPRLASCGAQAGLGNVWVWVRAALRVRLPPDIAAALEDAVLCDVMRIAKDGKKEGSERGAIVDVIVVVIVASRESRGVPIIPESSDEAVAFWQLRILERLHCVPCWACFGFATSALCIGAWRIRIDEAAISSPASRGFPVVFVCVTPRHTVKPCLAFL
jgi:hypothetical protein